MIWNNFKEGLKTQLHFSGHVTNFKNLLFKIKNGTASKRERSTKLYVRTIVFNETTLYC